MNAVLYEICAGLVEVMPWLMQGIALVILPRKRGGAWWAMVVGTTIQILARIGMSVIMGQLSKVSGLEAISKPTCTRKRDASDSAHGFDRGSMGCS
jgi:hypothetical protein